MSFNIALYIDGLRSALEELPQKARVAFAVWCAEALLQEVREYLAGKTAGAQNLAVQEAIDYLWSIASGHAADADEARRLEQACAAIDWREESVAAGEETRNVFAIETVSSLCCALETCTTGSALSAAKAAENVLNKLDWQLSNELCVDSYSEAIWSAPKWMAELESQQRMLEFLRDHAGLDAEQHHLFRQ